ncbi:MAG: hypothetical protein C4321_09490, partial [Chloroflexota bacterium]
MEALFGKGWAQVLEERSPLGTESAPPESGDVALFIDWENFKISLSKLGMKPSITELTDDLRERYGRLVIARAYADWQDRTYVDWDDQRNLYYAGIEPIYVPTRKDTDRPERRRNSVDVKMSTDCLEVSYTNRHIRWFVIVSGDADFIHVTNSLRSRGNRVVVIGVSGSTSNRISDSVDELLYYDRDIDQAGALPQMGGAAPRSAAPGDLEKAVDQAAPAIFENCGQ